jgi:hypothetical protein
VRVFQSAVIPAESRVRNLLFNGSAGAVEEK